MANYYQILLALIGGILPAFVWLVFWLREDNTKPEPRPLLAFVFLAGAFAVVPTYYIQNVLHQIWQLNTGGALVPTVLTWAASEELIKYFVVALFAFSTRFYDEPVDAMIYLITAALGFAAAENSFFMISALLDNASQVNFWLSGNFRFIGATIVHIVSSSVLGGFIALAFYQRWSRRTLALIGGLITATLLHASFNYFIIKSGDGEILKVFILFWALAIVVIYLFEKVKFLVHKNYYG